ncbi:unnamed protein product [Thelazia callipaeda]|uniref:Laminin subunit alpha n=1 Tax=Thelazia callipaeda TaxID=103827 RepID=A0A0N5CM86_THECL|nr:unnamed protein product [Thelazia callipaeda]
MLFLLLLLLLLVAVEANLIKGQVLVPPYTNLALGRKIEASSTCGEITGQPIKEIYCQIAGSSQYNPLNQYSYSTGEDGISVFAELKMGKQSFVQGGQMCDFCQANSSFAHPATNMVDGRASWWQSPPLSRGMQYNQVNISIDLEQEFHVAYVWIQMANSPRPGSWVLERSVDGGKIYNPWQYFAETPAECDRLFGRHTLQPIVSDDTVICTHEFSGIHPMENAEIMINLLENRPGKHNFSHSEVLQNFTRATNVRLRLLRTKTLHGHLMDVNRRDPTVTRRYFYAIKEIFMGGRCVCNGHADTCDILDIRRSNTLLCRCEHNTCGDHCEHCCAGYEQKRWQRSKEGAEFVCEPCNCHGHSDECVYEEKLDKIHASLDIHGNYAGGGRCLNCKHNTEGINCNKCTYGYYRPKGKFWNQTDVCQPCICDPEKHSGGCEDETGHCFCKDQFTGKNCDKCAPGYYSPPECKPCDCSVNGTLDKICLPTNGRCPCKSNYVGNLCNSCAPGYTNITGGCVGITMFFLISACKCSKFGSLHNNCDESSAQCMCKANFAGLNCESCADGYFDHSRCEYCDCDTSGTEDGICDKETGTCLCKPGFSGSRCDQCSSNYYGYPHCKECGCNQQGSRSVECDRKTGDCPCYANFTSKKCDRCAAGFYDYPNCKPCSCLATGSKGMTCDSTGQCYCKPNFQGQRCDQCKTNFYNFPICEECNCNPKGVVTSFAGCDQVAPGDLCTCKKHVTGRICDQCKPTYWDLQYHHENGCIKCECNLAGTISELNDCTLVEGQCNCKRHVAGRRCEKCADGFFQLEAHNKFGCKACKCDIGGALGVSCDMETGECRCRPRITGQKCDKPIQNHYFPTLWHNKYEAEDGLSAENKPVRFATDTSKFSNYSWKGYVVFSPIQEDVLLDVTVSKASLYRLLLHYVNPTDIQINVRITVIPLFTHTQDVEQISRMSFPVAVEPLTIAVNPKQPFVLNPGKWRIKISTKQRLFLDHIVLLPSEYYEGTVLKERVFEPCHALDSHNTTCFDMLYPPFPFTSRADITGYGSFMQKQKNGSMSLLEKISEMKLPVNVGHAGLIRADDEDREIYIYLEVPEDDDYLILLEYHNANVKTIPLIVQAQQNGRLLMNGTVVLKNCPYSTFCREVVSSNGSVLSVALKHDNNVTVILGVEQDHEFGLATAYLVNAKDWNVDYLQQISVCIRKNGQCVSQWFPPAANGIVSEAESQMNLNISISGDKLPFSVANPRDVQVMALDENMGTVEVTGVVPSHGHYVFIVQYFNPDNTLLTVDVTLQNGHVHHAQVPFSYCPSVIGCRTLIRDKERPDVIQFAIEDKYTASFYFSERQKGPIYIDSITSLPFNSYSSTLLSPLPMDLSDEYIQECNTNNFENDPSNISDYCRQKVFSLTSDYNMAALPCECSSQGSTSFMCKEYGGECPCRANIIGRRCDRCASGYYSFPDCISSCPDNHLCDERTGQCFCPPHVEGKNCDSCVPYAFGYDPLIGCQLCGCHQNGSEGEQLQCDPDSGQCLCKANVGGRKCNECLPGFYGFPHCYECACEIKGTTEEICEATSATCKCKKNVIGENCDTCRTGAFDLRVSNPEGCAECFCFGATDRCRSSFLPVTFVNFDEEAWKVYPNKSVKLSNGRVVYHAENDSSDDVYFLAPIGSNHDFTTSYGLQLSFMISSDPKQNETAMSSAPDIQIVGNNTTLDFWAREQPANPRIPFIVEMKLLPENLMEATGQPTTRQTLMMVLHSLEELRIKACYYTNCESASVSELQLEIAKDEETNGDSYTASSVEICQCPSPYTGLSCQQCSPGYYRVNNGRYLGACVPCNCSGHSGSCDADTGICFDCQHDTFGDHCEFCRIGFYGDATKGGPYSCLPCACPYATEGNNFAISCQVSETGMLESCTCKEGYTSDYCDRCDIGYYGQPTAVNGVCQKCDCNNNNDLNIDGSCHPTSGQCDLCLNNTAGEHCEYCQTWYYGDAIEAKNCTNCMCNQCGSLLCDNKSGQCECLPNVEGKNCDHCVMNAWGFSQCHGCNMCNCGLASQSPQCDAETGQCSCMPGAAGQMCEICEYGYWNYGSTGCSKCDCEADLSMGTVCDVNTGQCHCQEGATGPRCDQCAEHYLRIPSFGCRLCDECVHSVVRDLDDLYSTVAFVNGTINNISTTALAGAHLKRIRTKISDLQKMRYPKQISHLKPVLDNHIGSVFDLGVGNLTDGLLDATNDVVDISVRANRSLDVLQSVNNNLHNVIDRTSIVSLQFTLDASRRIEEAASVVDSLKNLAFSLGKDSSAVDRQKWLGDSSLLLQQIRDDTKSEKAREYANNASNEVEKLLKHMQQQKNQNSEVREKFLRIKKQMEELLNNITDYQSFLDQVHKSVGYTMQRLNRSKIYDMNLVKAGVEAGDNKIKEALAIIYDLSSASEIFIDSLSHLNSTLGDTIRKVQNALGRLVVAHGGHHFRKIRHINKIEYLNKSKELEEKALHLSALFDITRNEAKSALTAANGYRELMNLFKKSKNMTNQALENAQKAKEFHAKGMVGVSSTVASAKTLREQSVDLLNAVVDLRHSSIQDVDGLKTSLDERATGLTSLIEKQKNIVESLQPKFDDVEMNRKLEYSLKTSQEVKERINDVVKDFVGLELDLEGVVNHSKKIVGSMSSSANALDTAREQILKLEHESLPIMKQLKMLRKAASNTSTTVESCREKLNLLKEKIALARDLANRIKLGAHFEKGSVLELPLPSRITRSAAYTNVEFSFRTISPDGLLLFFGNELGVAGTRAVPTDDYIALEVHKGRLRAVANLGDLPRDLISDTFVADGNWRRVAVERIGKIIKLRLSSPNAAIYDEEKIGTFTGSKSLLNLHQKKSRLFVGGIAPDIKISSDILNRNFNGDIEDLRIHGETVGLWNTKKGGNHNVQGAKKKDVSLSLTDEIALSFNGDGYAVHKLGIWNPQKQTVFSLTFQTYSPDGLVFYLGKERDFLSLELQDGSVKLSFDFGSGVGRLTSTGSNYNDGKPHSVYVHRLERHARMQVDDNDVAEGDSPGTMFELSVSDVFYLGGVPSDVSTLVHFIIESAILLYDCIYLNFNDHSVKTRAYKKL